ncbi:sensor histidine kinase NtrY-like [Pseudorhodoplanes sinuspersici]|uniref:histidine kinase n=1 Tax=Pseudorhodoplanes sinuspersici TaxID=1235591 RepID=A0A1W6ZWJ3_9HYPH|nr:PAS domain-containing sensor histidine kinase [Pseudorhodoplanes sinuspersici]ARQ01690.1 PAS domain-containing sensor histidine kinase [Pseudorhodoplanes sinuspersici]
MASADQSLPLDRSAGMPMGRRLSFRWISSTAVGAALLSALATFLVLSGLTPLPPTHNVVVSLLGINAIAALILIAVIAQEAYQIVQARRRGRAAARLHVRIVGLFAIIAAVPTILVAVVATITLDRGLDRFFSVRTKAIIENSLLVSEAYLREHAQMIQGDILAMAQDVARAKPLFDSDRERFQQFLTAQATIRGLPIAVILNGELEVIERTNLRVTQDFAIPNKEALKTLSETEPQIALLPDTNYVASVIKLRGYDSMYLYVARLLDPRVVSQLRETRASVSDYALMEARRLGVTVAFGLMYTVIALIVMLSAVLIGLNFANRLVAPIRRLIGAANVVATGNLHVQVPVHRSEGDLGQLGETFNRMTHDLRTQRDDLVNARDLIDSRRRFSEAVLAGASAGIIGVDHDGRISILNRSAEQLIASPGSDVMGKPLLAVAPELAELVRQAIDNGQRLTQGQVTLSRKGRERNLSVRVASEQTAEAEHGYVVTLDDITELVSAQRTSAWADVARRIAHEIKNPLTPIQLSAERLRRKYGKVITEDRAIFEQCTDTIVRQVDDIRRMVDEFSRFARMPKPVMEREDVADTVRQAVFLMRVGHPDIDIELSMVEDPMPARFDRRLVSQALTNIIKNGTEAIGVLPEGSPKGRIEVTATRVGDLVNIDVIDNGIGLPKEHRSRLLEPYVTTREKGTGLGLAIVGKILEDHGGGIELHDAAEKEPGRHGAWIRLRFAVNPPQASGTSSNEDSKTKRTSSVAT